MQMAERMVHVCGKETREMGQWRPRRDSENYSLYKGIYDMICDMI